MSVSLSEKVQLRRTKYDYCMDTGFGEEKLPRLKLYPNPLLRTVCTRVPDELFGTDELARQAADLRVQLVRLHKDTGLGMAANQIGHLFRFISIKTINEILFNPVIVKYNDESQIFKEGCLSVPLIYEPVERPSKIHVIFQRFETGEYIEFDADGLDATVIQHEIDHLDGILFFDRLAPNPKKMVMRKIEKQKWFKQGRLEL